jgi:hypothetical protein
MRSTSEIGMVLRSKNPTSAALPLTGSVRRPLMSTSGEPKIAPRSRTVVAPNVFSGDASDTSGRVCRNSAIDDWPLRSIDSRP